MLVYYFGYVVFLLLPSLSTDFLPQHCLVQPLTGSGVRKEKTSSTGNNNNSWAWMPLALPIFLGVTLSRLRWWVTKLSWLFYRFCYFVTPVSLLYSFWGFVDLNIWGHTSFTDNIDTDDLDIKINLNVNIIIFG